jgi:hypothetical protein
MLDQHTAIWPIVLIWLCGWLVGTAGALLLAGLLRIFKRNRTQGDDYAE